MQFRIVDDGLWRRTVGVMGDGRTYEYVVGLRALTSA
jgi:GMP synthase PP-ATPase subunit